MTDQGRTLSHTLDGCAKYCGLTRRAKEKTSLAVQSWSSEWPMHCAISWQAPVKKCDLRCKLQPVQRVGRVKSFAKLHRTFAMHCNALGMKLISFLNQLSNSDWHYKLGLRVCWWLTTTTCCLTLFRLVTSRVESSLDAFCHCQAWVMAVWRVQIKTSVVQQ